MYDLIISRYSGNDIYVLIDGITTSLAASVQSDQKRNYDLALT